MATMGTMQRGVRASSYAAAAPGPSAVAAAASTSSAHGVHQQRPAMQPKPPAQFPHSSPPLPEAGKPVSPMTNVSRSGVAGLPAEASDSATRAMAPANGRRPLKPLAAVHAPGALAPRAPSPHIAPGQAAAAQEALEADWRRREAEEVERDRRRQLETEREASAQAEEEAKRLSQQRRASEVAAREREKAGAAAAAQALEERHRKDAERQRAAEAAETERRRTAEVAEAERQRAALLEAEMQRRAAEEAREAAAKAAEAAERAAALEAEQKRRAEREAEDLRKEREEAELRRRASEAPASSSVAAAEASEDKDEVVRALVTLRKRYLEEDPAGLATCLQTLRSYIGNLARNPHDAKFQRIKCDNAAFRSRIAAFDGASGVLRACGFQEEDGALVCDPAFLKTKGPRLWDALAKVDVMHDQAKQRGGGA